MLDTLHRFVLDTDDHWPDLSGPARRRHRGAASAQPNGDKRLGIAAIGSHRCHTSGSPLCVPIHK